MSTVSQESAPAIVNRPRLLFFVTEDWYFCSHRLPLAVAAKRAGYDVIVVTRVRDHGDRIVAQGIQLVPITLSRHGMNPLLDVLLLWRLAATYRALRPDIVHHVGMKPVLYGSIAARLARVPAVVNAFAGLGYLYISSKRDARFVRGIMEWALRWAIKGRKARVIVQNPEDRQRLIRARVCGPADTVLIRGAGVDPARYALQPEPVDVPVVMLASRMLWEKGVGDFVAMARRLRAVGVSARFVLVGESDPNSPAAVPTTQLQEWHRVGDIEWWGWRDDMPEVFAQCAVVCLPTTYGEGVPKVLIEAAASGRAIVAYDVPGCREIVRNGENGELVPAGSVPALAQAVRALLMDSARREAMGRRGRAIVLEEFQQRLVVDQTLAVYRELHAPDESARC